MNSELKKRIFLELGNVLILFMSLFLFSCKHDKIENDVILRDEIKEVYLNLDTNLGLEIYCYCDSNDEYHAILLPGVINKTNRGFYDSINELKENSECSLKEMNEILKSYPDEIKKYISVYIIPNNLKKGQVFNKLSNSVGYSDNVALIRKILGLGDTNTDIKFAKMLDKYNSAIIYDLEGTSHKLNITLEPTNVNINSCSYISTDPNIASVDSDGNVIFKSKGMCFIKANIDGYIVDQAVCVGKIESLEKPSDCNLDFWIGEDVSITRLDEYDFDSSGSYFLGRGYNYVDIDERTKKYPETYVSYYRSGYPDYSYFKKHITGIIIKDSKVKLYGLTTDSSIDEFDNTFKNMGYEIKIKNNFHYALKDDFEFSFDGLEIHIYVKTTNVFN